MSPADDRRPGSAAHELARSLAARLSELHGADVTVDGLRRLSGGASFETWQCRVRRPGEERSLILRRQPPNEQRPELMRREVAALAAAGRHGVPGPELIDWSDESHRLGGAYLLMSFVPGETIARRILRDARFAGARARLASDLGRAAALIHRVPAEETPDIQDADGLDLLWQRYHLADVPRPVFELAFQWLAAEQPDPLPSALVHGDYRLGNVIVDEGGLAAVLDWELVHRGDPMEDLGYLCIRAWRFGGAQPVAGVGTFEQLFDAYEAASGAVPDPDRVRWWQIAGTLNWGISCLLQANRHFRGLHRSVELAAIGRRVAEQEYDLLQMIGSRTAPR